MTASVPAWEVTLLLRPAGSSQPHVGGRVVLEAPDLDVARRRAEELLTERREGSRTAADGAVWSLGVLRPLTPRAPGTRHYRVVFARWEPHEDHFERRDVHELELWAVDAASARRQAQHDVQANPDYEPAWRIRTIIRM